MTSKLLKKEALVPIKLIKRDDGDVISHDTYMINVLFGRDYVMKPVLGKLKGGTVVVYYWNNGYGLTTHRTIIPSFNVSNLLINRRGFILYYNDSTEEPGWYYFLKTPFSMKHEKVEVVFEA